MKLFGYYNEGLPIEQVVPAELAEITLCATPGELRKMAEFFETCAAAMDRMGQVYEHVHLSDQVKEFGASPQFVVARLDE